MSEQEYLVKRCIPLLLVNQLKACIRSFNEVTGSHLRVSGSKGELIQRIQQFTEEKYSKGDGSDCAPVQQIILAHFGSTLPLFEGSSSIINSTLNKVITPRPACDGRIFNNKAGYSDRELSIKSTPKRGIIEDSEFIFKPSPFYEVIELLSEIKVCPVLQEKAALVRLDFQLKKHHVANLQHQSSSSRDFGIKLFACAYDRSGQTLDENSQVLMEFPPLCEVKINTTVLQTSLRGLKNKPGTVNPPEITDLCHIDSTSFNRIEFMYANTSKNYVIMAKLVRKHSVDSIINTIIRSKRLSKEEALQKIKRENKDADIIATSCVISLKCPLSYQRVKLPCRSTLCPHIQCFDGFTFFTMNEQTPTWTCPTCNRSLAWDTIVVDGYFEDILQKVPEDIESILVEPNGDWSIQEDKSKQIMDPDDLDLQLDSSDSKATGSKKRKSEVIDLTLESGSDEDEDTFVMFKRSESVSASTMPLSQRFPNLAEIPLPMQITSHAGARSTVVYPDRAPEVEMYRIYPMEPSISEGQSALLRHENQDNLNDNIPGINSVSISSNSGLSYLCNTNATDLQLTAPFIPPSNGLHLAQSRNDQRYSDIYSRSLSPISFPPAPVALRRTPTDQMQIERLSPLTYRDNYYERIYNPFRYGASDSFPRITDYRGPPSYTPEAHRFQYSKPYSPMITTDNARGPPCYPGRIWESPILKLSERHFPSECSGSEHTQLPEQYYNNQSQDIEVIQDSETQS